MNSTQAHKGAAAEARGKKFQTGSLLASALFLGLLVVFFHEIFFAGKVLISKTSDSYYSHYSWAAYFKNVIRQGAAVPLWNPLSFCGTPYGANSMSNVCLLNVLVALFKDVSLAWNVRLLSNIFLSALFTFLYVRKLGLSTFAGIIAGIVYGFCPYAQSYTVNFGESYSFFIPLCLFFIEHYSRSQNPVFVLLAGFAITLCILSSNPQFSLYLGVFFSLYVLFRFRSWLGFLVVLFSAGSAAFYAFRMLEAVSISQRPGLWFLNVLFPTHFITMIFPFLFESPFRPETNFFFAHFFNEAARLSPLTSRLTYIFPPYIGILGITLCLLAWKERRPALSIFRSAVLFILFYWMTFPVLSPVYGLIPGIGRIPGVERIGAVLTFSLAVLAGAGAEAVRERRFSLKPLILFYVALFGAVAGVLSLTRFLIRFKSEDIRTFFLDYIQRRVLGTPEHIHSLDFYAERVDQFFIFIRQWTDLASPSILLPLLFVTATLALLGMWQKGRLEKKFFYSLCVLVLSADVLIFFRASLYPTASRDEIEVNSGAIDFLKKDKSSFRVLGLLEGMRHGTAVSTLTERVPLSAEANLIYGLSSIEGFDSFYLKRYHDFFYNFINHYDLAYPGALAGTEGNFDYRLADFLNVKYFVAPKNSRLKRDLPVAFEDDRYTVYLNPTHYPRAFLVFDYVVKKDGKEALEFLKRDEMKFDQEVVLEEEPVLQVKDAAPTPAAGENKVNIRSYEADSLTLDVSASRNGLLVMSEAHYPGWNAAVDGRAAKIFRANHAFRAVEIPAGSHEVRFDYRPRSLAAGTAVSVGFVVLGTILIFSRRPALTADWLG